MIEKRKLALLRPFILVFGVLLLFIFNARSQDTIAPLKILFIGNSYTHMNDMPHIFDKMAKKAGKNVHIEKNTQGGASFRIHSGRADLFESIKKHNWDYVVLQGFSREMTYQKERLDTATIPFINQIRDSIYKYSPCANLMFYMTWGYEDGFKERYDIDSYEKMANSVKEGYRLIGEHYKIPVVPVGMVWKEVRETSAINLYDPDHAHPNINGSYLIASTFYSAIFNEPVKKNYSYTIDKKTANLLKKSAFTYVTDHSNEYGLDKNVLGVDYYFNTRGIGSVTFHSNFTDVDSVAWHFGDGTIRKETSGKHTYLEKGNHTVELLVYAQCGVLKYSKEITKDKCIQRRRKRSRQRKRTIEVTKP